MKYYDIMESFHRRVAAIYKAANEKNLGPDYVNRALDKAVSETMDQLAEHRRLPRDGRFCTVKALIF